MTFYKRDNQMRELINRSAAKTWKMILLKVTFELNANGVVLKEIIDLGNIDTATIVETRHTGPGIEEHDHDKKYEDVLEEVTP